MNNCQESSRDRITFLTYLEYNLDIPNVRFSGALRNPAYHDCSTTSAPMNRNYRFEVHGLSQCIALAVLFLP